jgi:hypothetical protein
MSQYSSAEFILIESPGWNDAEFYGKWLLAAAQAQRLWTEAVETDCEFKLQIERLEVIGPMEFGTEAFRIIGKLSENVRTMIVRADTDLGDSIALMARTGFFARTGERYQMVLPPRLKSSGRLVWLWQPPKTKAMKFIPSSWCPPCRSHQPKHGKPDYKTWTKHNASPIASFSFAMTEKAAREGMQAMDSLKPVTSAEALATSRTMPCSPMTPAHPARRYRPAWSRARKVRDLPWRPCPYGRQRTPASACHPARYNNGGTL